MRSFRAIALLSAIALASACGSSGSATEPSTTTSTQLLVPTEFIVSTQKFNATNNQVTMTWLGNGTSYLLTIGTASGSSNVLSAEVTGNSYTWTSPRTGGSYFARVAAKRGDATTAFSSELTVFVLDIRNVIDALFFRSGPMADSPTTASTNPSANIWADGTRVRILVSNEAGETARANAQTFVDQYAALVGGAVTATTEFTSDTMRGASYPALFPDFTIGIRIQPGFCGGALGCVPVVDGPSSKKAIVTLEQSTGLTVSATAHEVAHAYGFGHVTVPVSGRPEFRFMMNPAYLSEQMTDAEKLAITVARQGGIRPGMTRNQALALDLVNPFTG